MIASDRFDRLVYRVNANNACAAVDFQKLVQITADVRIGESILDVGCGFCHILAPLACQNGGAPVLGLDVNEESVRRANEYFRQGGLRSARAVVHDAANVPFLADGFPLPNESFDIALSTSALYNFGRNNSAHQVTANHREGVNRAVAEVYRLLKPGGRFIVNSPTPGNTRDVVRLARAGGATNERAFQQIRLPEAVTGEVIIPALANAFADVRIAHVRNPVTFDEEHLDALIGYFLSCDFWTNTDLLEGKNRCDYLAEVVRHIAQEVNEHGNFRIEKDFLLFVCWKEGGGKPKNPLPELVAAYPPFVREVGIEEAVCLAKEEH